MFDPDLLGLLLHECAYEPRVPQIASHAEIFATAHQRVRFATFGRCRDTLSREVVLFAARDRDESVMSGQLVSIIL